MDVKQKILLSFAAVILFSLCVLIIFGDNGLSELQFLRQKRDRLVEQNEQVIRENLSLFREMERLENDLTYIENVARQQLGFIGKGEVILKLNDSTEKKDEGH
jgi:cell division protein FtsB